MSDLCEYYQRIVDKLNIYVPGSANVYNEGSVPPKYLIKSKYNENSAKEMLRMKNKWLTLQVGTG